MKKAICRISQHDIDIIHADFRNMKQHYLLSWTHLWSKGIQHGQDRGVPSLDGACLGEQEKGLGRGKLERDSVVLGDVCFFYKLKQV